MGRPSKKSIVEAKVSSLVQRINQHNTAQQVKKLELGLLPNIWSSENIGMYRQRFYALQSMESGLDQVSREQVVRLARELFFKLPGIGMASELKAGYVVGNHWKLQFRGKDPERNKRIEDWFNKKWAKNCCVREYMQWHGMLKVLSRTLDQDGDVLMLKVQNRQGWPMLQFLGNERVGNITGIGTDHGRVEYKGKMYKTWDGVVYDDASRVIAYTIREDQAQYATVPPDPKIPTKPQVIGAENAMLIMKPLVVDKGRGLSALYSSVLYGLQLQDLDNFLMDIAKLEATIAYIIQNDAGQAPQEYENLLNQIQSLSDVSNTVTLPGISPTVHGVTLQKTPTINYIKSDGGDLKSFRSQRPSEEIQSYRKTIESLLMSCIGIPHQMVYSPDQIAGRAVNAVTQVIRTSVFDRISTLQQYMKKAAAWALAVAMENDFLEKNYEDDLEESIHFTCPPPFTLDDNNDNYARLELYKVGLISGEEFCRLNNMSFKDICEQRDQENDVLLGYVEKAKAKHPSISEATILNLFTQRGTSTLSMKDEGDPIPEKPKDDNER